MADLKENALFAYLESLATTNTERELLDELKIAYERPTDEEVAVMVAREADLRAQAKAKADRAAAEVTARAARAAAAVQAAADLETAKERAAATAAAAQADGVAAGPGTILPADTQVEAAVA